MGELCFFMSTRRILLLLVSLFASVAMMAQNVNVTVKLQDASNDEPIGFATVSLTPEKGSAKYSLTDNNGKGTIEKVKVGKYTFKAEIMGYKSYEKAVEVTKEATDLGVVKMELDQRVLDAASVTATGNPIIIKKDTVEYNASSFKTTDTDMLINLLKKLPGIEVDDNGSITANGETITKITIDGKTFFLDDPSIASQNLPAKMIEKVKVVKKKSEQAEFTGIDDGNDETIIDLSVQKSMMNGVFGNVTGGVGHDIPSKENDMNDWRFNGNGMIGRFTDSNQISIIANGNNGAGGMGFTNMGGNMMGQMMGGGRGMGGFGGGMGGFGGGITTSWMGGVNAAADLLDNRMEFSGNYMYSGSNTESMQDSYQENYYADWTQIQETQNTSYQRNNGHRVGVRIDHKFSDNTSILFQPQFNYSQGGYNQTQVFDTWRQNKGSDEAVKATDGFSTNYGTILLFLLIGSVLTAMVQSSAALMAITMVLCSTGAISIYQGIALVMGENIGTTVTANLAALSANVQARRTALAHLVFNVFGVIWVLLIFFPFVRFVCGLVGLDPTADSQSPVQLSFALAAFHTAFNVINTAVLIWFIPQIEKLVCFLIQPSKEEREESFRLQYIHGGIMKTPEISLLQAQKEISLFGRHMQQMIGLVKELSQTTDPESFGKLLERIRKYEDFSDRMENEIGKYLSEVGQAHLSDDSKAKISGMFRQIGELESIGDSGFNLGRILQRKQDNKVVFSEAEENGIIEMYKLVDAAMTRMNQMLDGRKEDFDIGLSASYEQSINDLRANLKQQNIQDLDKQVYNYDNGTVFMDLVNEYEKVGDYVLNVAEARLGL